MPRFLTVTTSQIVGSVKVFEETAETAHGGSLYDAMFQIGRRNWRFKDGIDEIRDVINALQNRNFSDVGDMVRYLRARLDIDKFVLKGIDANSEEISEKINNLDALEKMCCDFHTIKDFLLYVKQNLTKNKEMAAKGDNVKLMTIHKSKGLEFPVVFVSGCSDGLLPHIRNENVDDEKRLFYVAMTRAEKELYLTHSDKYNGKVYRVSSFVKCLDKTIDIQS